MRSAFPLLFTILREPKVVPENAAAKGAGFDKRFVMMYPHDFESKKSESWEEGATEK